MNENDVYVAYEEEIHDLRESLAAEKTKYRGNLKRIAAVSVLIIAALVVALLIVSAVAVGLIQSSSR